jgi:hypothetical protein
MRRGTSPYLHGEPPLGRRHPVKAASREARARDACQPLPDGTGLAPCLQAGDDIGDTHKPPFPAEAPFDATGIAHDAGDVLADALVEHGLPRHQAEVLLQ